MNKSKCIYAIIEIIEIEEAGSYTFYITGAKAKGSVYFIKS